MIYLFMSGGPSHIDLFDPKPTLDKRTGEELPASVRGGQRITGMTSGQSKLLMVGGAAKFARHGESGAEITELHAPPGVDRRRDLDRPLDAHRPDQPRPGRHLPADGQPAAGPPHAGLVALVRPGERQPEPPRLRRADLRGRAASRSSPATGTTASSPAAIRACRSGRRATRSCTSRTPTGSTPGSAARSSTASAS